MAIGRVRELLDNGLRTRSIRRVTSRWRAENQLVRWQPYPRKTVFLSKSSPDWWPGPRRFGTGRRI